LIVRYQRTRAAVKKVVFHAQRTDHAMEKSRLIKQIVASLSQSLGVLEKAARASHAEATHESSKAESKYPADRIELMKRIRPPTMDVSYLFAFDVKREAMRTFALVRLKSPEITTERFTIPKKFNLNEYLKGSFNVFKGADDYEVVIEFDSWAADLIRGRKWHTSQEVMELPGRQVRLRLRLNSIEEAERWALSWGKHAMVIRPQALADRLRETAKVLLARYQS